MPGEWDNVGESGGNGRLDGDERRAGEFEYESD